MEIVKVERDASEVIVSSDLSAAEFDGLREWFCYTKPIGGSVKLVGRANSCESCDFSIRTTGTELELDQASATVLA